MMGFGFLVSGRRIDYHINPESRAHTHTHITKEERGGSGNPLVTLCEQRYFACLTFGAAMRGRLEMLSLVSLLSLGLWFSNSFLYGV